jgi:phosphoglycerate dehydrogenase-like enzyme
VRTLTDVVVVNEPFERWWSFSADHAAHRWAGPALRFIRLAPGDRTPLAGLELPADTERMLLLTLGLDIALDLAKLPRLRELGTLEPPRDAVAAALREHGVDVYAPRNEGYWGQSVAEFALGLTIGALRRIPQTARAMIDSLEEWSYLPAEGMGRPGARAAQLGDDSAFVSGTVAGKRVRVVGMGNIGARYASFCAALGADVAAWSASAPDPVFHRSGARRVLRLPELIADAEIVAPMLPLVPGTEGLVTAELIDSMPRGSLLVLVTRAHVVHMPAVRRRVLADEIALAADVFDVEPVPLGDPLLGRHNVVHTPHNAGRTIDANRALVNALLEQFRVRPSENGGAG